MLTLVWIAVIATVGIAIALVIRQQKRLTHRQQPALVSLNRTVFTLQLGDIVQYDAADWVVEGCLTYNSGGYTWLEYLLQDGDRLRWLAVEEDDIVEVYWLEPYTDLEISGTPPRQLTVAGITYKQTEAGTARLSRQGRTLNRQAEVCHYFDYAGTADRVLCVEDWMGEIEVTIGQRIRPSMLRLLPGDGRRVYDT